MQLGLYTGIPPVHTTQSYSNANFNSLYSPEPQHSKYHLQAHVPPPIHPDFRRDEHSKCLQAVREATCPTYPNEVYNPNSNPLFAAIPMLLSTPDRILSDTHPLILAYALLKPRLTYAVP